MNKRFVVKCHWIYSAINKQANYVDVSTPTRRQEIIIRNLIASFKQ